MRSHCAYKTDHAQKTKKNVHKLSIMPKYEVNLIRESKSNRVDRYLSLLRLNFSYVTVM